MTKFISGLLIGAAIVGGLFLYSTKTELKLGSVTQGNAYRFATSTTAGAVLVKTGPMTLGSVIVVKADAHAFVIFNATSTTDTAAKIVTTLPASLATGTYTFDMELGRGLVIVPAASFAGEYITTYR